MFILVESLRERKENKKKVSVYIEHGCLVQISKFSDWAGRMASLYGEFPVTLNAPPRTSNWGKEMTSLG